MIRLKLTRYRLTLSLSLALAIGCSDSTYLERAAVESEAPRSSQSDRLRSDATGLDSTTLVIPTVAPTGPLKGWDYLVGELTKSGPSRAALEQIFSDPLMPERGFIPFGAAPRESFALYQGMLTPKRIAEARACYQTHKGVINRVATAQHVPSSVITSIMYVETGCGRNLGTQLVLPRLARLVGLAAPDNVAWNYGRLRDAGEPVTYAQIAARAVYLQETFLEQIHALISLAAHAGSSPFSFKGSTAGAFGVPQFLPLSLVRYGTDGDGDHRVDLNTIPDAAASIANYLAKNGWKVKMTRAEKMTALFTYNRSEPYGETVLKIAAKLSVKTHVRKQG